MSGPDVRITITAHPPERGRAGSLAPAQAGASCCCCCCCLHSLGALVGAVVAPGLKGRQGPRTQEEHDYADFPEQAGPRYGSSAVFIFWLSTVILGSVVIMGGGGLALAQGRDPVSGVLMAGFSIIMLFPALLLVAAAATAIALGVSSRPDKPREFGQLGRICVGVVLGTIIGVVPMGVCLFAMTR